jgi:hypothetical protein
MSPNESWSRKANTRHAYSAPRAASCAAYRRSSVRCAQAKARAGICGIAESPKAKRYPCPPQSSKYWALSSMCTAFVRCTTYARTNADSTYKMALRRDQPLANWLVRRSGTVWLRDSQPAKEHAMTSPNVLFWVQREGRYRLSEAQGEHEGDGGTISADHNHATSHILEARNPCDDALDWRRRII